MGSVDLVERFPTSIRSLRTELSKFGSENGRPRQRLEFLRLMNEMSPQPRFARPSAMPPVRCAAGRWAYNQRSPSEYTFFRPFPRLVLGFISADFCVQGRIFQRFSSSTFFLCTVPDFFDFSEPLHQVCKIQRIFR